jgi:DnaJ-class molecular chaperone
MSKSSYNTRECKDCKGNGFIVAPSSKTIHSCIICNGSGTTSHGPRSESEQVMLFKIAWDYIHGKEKGWYH